MLVWLIYSTQIKLDSYAETVKKKYTFISGGEMATRPNPEVPRSIYLSRCDV